MKYFKDTHLEITPISMQESKPQLTIPSKSYLRHSCYHTYLNAKQGIKYVSNLSFDQEDDDCYSPKFGYKRIYKQKILRKVLPKDTNFNYIATKNDIANIEVGQNEKLKYKKASLLDSYDEDYETLVNQFAKTKLTFEGFYNEFENRYNILNDKIKEMLKSHQGIPGIQDYEIKLNQILQDFREELQKSKEKINSLTTLHSVINQDINLIPFNCLGSVAPFNNIIQKLLQRFFTEKKIDDYTGFLYKDLRFIFNRASNGFYFLIQELESFQYKYTHYMHLIKFGVEPPKEYNTMGEVWKNDTECDYLSNSSDLSYDPQFEDSIENESQYSDQIEGEVQENESFRKFSFAFQQDNYYKKISKNFSTKYYKYFGTILPFSETFNNLDTKTLLALRKQKNIKNFSLSYFNHKFYINEQTLYFIVKGFLRLESLEIDIYENNWRDQDQFNNFFRILQKCSPRLKSCTLKLSEFTYQNQQNINKDTKLKQFISSLRTVQNLEIHLFDKLSQSSLYESFSLLKNLKILNLVKDELDFEWVLSLIERINQFIIELRIEANINMKNQKIGLSGIFQIFNTCTKLRELSYKGYLINNPENYLYIRSKIPKVCPQQYSNNIQSVNIHLQNGFTTHDVYPSLLHYELNDFFNDLPCIFPKVENLTILADFKNLLHHEISTWEKFNVTDSSHLPKVDSVGATWKDFKYLQSLSLSHEIEILVRGFQQLSQIPMQSTQFFKHISEIPQLQKLKLQLQNTPTPPQVDQIFEYLSQIQTLEYFHYNCWMNGPHPQFDKAPYNEDEWIIDEYEYCNIPEKVFVKQVLSKLDVQPFLKLQSKENLKFLLTIRFTIGFQYKYVAKFEQVFLSGFPLKIIDSSEYIQSREL